MGLNLAEWPEFWVRAFVATIQFSILLVICLHIAPLMVWLERRAPALMQRRKGPNRVGFFRFRLFGLLQPLADAIKLIFKEEVMPDGANKLFYHLAPAIALFPAFLIAAAIPYGNDFTIGSYVIPMSIIRLDVGFLFILAMSSIAVYGVALAGWASNNKYSLLGGMRASAQMISYEIPLGMSLLPIVLMYGTLDLNEIVLQQSLVWGVFAFPPVGIIAFVIFLICMFAETNRAPFDMAEGESEIVAGFHTEYNSFKFSQFFLAEYVAMFVLSCLAATLFFGGWQMPFIPYDTLLQIVGGNTLVASLIGVSVLFVKAGFFMWLFVWVRWTLPRFRYDQLMALGWKFLFPLSLANIILAAIMVGLARF